MTTNTYVNQNDIRTKFSQAISCMYRNEVPQYGVLIDLVESINDTTLQNNPALKTQLEEGNELKRLNIERHGAIRLGTAQELSQIRRMFAVMGMEPVDYYDLSAAGLPVHSTAFRPITLEALKHNPFRVFTSLVRLELLEDKALENEARRILSSREILTQKAISLIEKFEHMGGLKEPDVEVFIKECLYTFRWHSETTVPYETYKKLNDINSLIADVVCFPGPHINHLTPRTLDIDAAHKEMPRRNMIPKDTIEGPPHRNVNILLRQTSFKALTENIIFKDVHSQSVGTHTARFGEIEHRGAALTPKGRSIYDQYLRDAQENANDNKNISYEAHLEQAFSSFPKSLKELHKEGLIYVRYQRDVNIGLSTSDTLDSAIEKGHLKIIPQTYEDFLPVSAAGIFRSNLSRTPQSAYDTMSNQHAFEHALGVSVHSSNELYQQVQDESYYEFRSLITTSNATIE